MNPKSSLDPYLKNLASVSRSLALAKVFSWISWAILFIWAAYQDLTLGWLILLCLLGTWLVVKLTYDFERLSERVEQMDREFQQRKGEEALQAQIEALKKVEETPFARALDAEWEKLRTERGVRYAGAEERPFTDGLGRPLSESALQALSVDRLKLIVRLALERPGDYRAFCKPLQTGNPYLAALLPSPEDVEKNGPGAGVTEFLNRWRAGEKLS